MVMPADDGYQRVAALLSWHESGAAAWRGPAPKAFLEQHCRDHKVSVRYFGTVIHTAHMCVVGWNGRLEGWQRWEVVAYAQALLLSLRGARAHAPGCMAATAALPAHPPGFPRSNLVPPRCRPPPHTHHLPQLPAPCFNVFEHDRTPARTHFCATCLLPHAGLQLTPDAVYPSPLDAMENAALLALLYLDGSLAPGCSLVHFAPAGDMAQVCGWVGGCKGVGVLVGRGVRDGVRRAVFSVRGCVGGGVRRGWAGMPACEGWRCWWCSWQRR